EVDRDRGAEAVSAPPVGEAEVAAEQSDERDADQQVFGALRLVDEEDVGRVGEAEDQRAVDPSFRLAGGAGEAGLDEAAEDRLFGDRDMLEEGDADRAGERVADRAVHLLAEDDRALAEVGGVVRAVDDPRDEDAGAEGAEDAGPDVWF